MADESTHSDARAAAAQKADSSAAPAININPNQKYLSMQEMTKHTAIKSYTLRYWEQQIPELATYIERSGNRRRYLTQGVATFMQIRRLLDDEGYTLKGVRTALFPPAARKKNNTQKTRLAHVRQSLQKIIKTLG